MLREAKFQATLRQAGHQLVVASDEAHLQQALTKGRFDVVLADFAQMAAFERHASAAASQPLALPVVDQSIKSQPDACKQQFTCQLKSTDKADRFLVVIDGAMRTRARAQQAQNKPR